MVAHRRQKYSFEIRKTERKVENTVKRLRKVQWKYRNSIYLVVGILIAYAIINYSNLGVVVSNFRDLGYMGSIISGFMYAFSLTAAPATAIFYKLGAVLNPVYIAALGALGCVVGDFFIFKFVKDKLMEELKLLTEEIGDKIVFQSKTILNHSAFQSSIFQNSLFYRLFPFSNLLLSKKFRITMLKAANLKAWKIFVAILAGLIIASPLPDEIGIALLGMIKYKTKYFLLYSFLLNFIGIFLISYLGLVR